MYENYTEKKREIKAPLHFISTHYTACKPARRCKNHQTCITCKKIWIKQQIKKTTHHLTPAMLKKYSRKYYITINPTWFNIEIDESVSSLELFVKGLIANKRAKSSLLNNSEYIFIKEISHSKKLGYHAHYNLILLTNKKISNQEIKGYRLHVTPISETLNSEHSKAKYNHQSAVIQNIKNIIAYSLKADTKRINLERIFNLSKGKHDILNSSLFKYKEENKQTNFSIHINSIKEARKHAKEARKHALRVYECIKVLKPNINSVTLYKEALKLKRKINNINDRLKRQIRAAQPRQKSKKERTHKTKT